MEKQSHNYLESACMATFTCPRGCQGVHALRWVTSLSSFFLLWMYLSHFQAVFKAYARGSQFSLANELHKPH